ncbi:MAG TPA: GAF domain-containing protein [Terriglobales bacterium]|jgi:hypothetical protein|nr:GAF domain-containing protein [Terriglobales bacterium]
MDPSAPRSHGQKLPEEPEDSCDAFPQDRRRNPRQKLHSPVYVSFDGPDSGLAVDLSELLDLHEEGFAVQTAERLEVNRTVTLCLDLPETKSYIHSSGEVIWSDQSGRGGIRFRALSDRSRQILRQWLFANLLIASDNHASQSRQCPRPEEERIIGPVPLAASEPEIRTEPSSVVGRPPRIEAVPIESVRHEIRELEDDVDRVLEVLTERARNLTGATGAALAFLTRPSNCSSNDEQMLCCARCGDPAPPLGSPVEIKHGLSGECVRTGQIVSCDDMANTKDPRIDPEVGRTLGIGSLIAVPIVSDFRVVGLLEVFSPHPHAFATAHATILERLVEMIPNIHRQVSNPETTQLKSPQPAERRTPVLAPDGTMPIKSTPRPILCPTQLAEPAAEPRAEPRAETHAETHAEAPGDPPRLVYRALLGLVTVVVATVLGYVIGPIIGKHWLLSPQSAQQTSAEVVEAASSASGQRPQATSLAELQRLADQGDADARWQMGIRCHASNPPDDAQAMHWFERAADQGYVAAQATLGAYYWAGRGVPSDLSKAYMWSAIAFAGGDQNSKIRLEGLASQMTRAQISAARQQAETWIHQHNAAKQP